MTRFLFILLLVTMNVKAADDMIAIDIAMVPEVKLDTIAKTINQATPGFHFDDSHFPHLTLFQGVVKKSDLPKILSDIRKEDLSLKTKGLEVKEKLLNLNFESSEKLSELQERIVKMVKTYTVKSPEKSAFYEPLTVRDEDVEYARTFVEKKSGKNYSPHMTLGLAPEKMPKNPEEDSFYFNGPEVFQIGEFGSARKKITR
jgi:hypothetical protein